MGAIIRWAPRVSEPCDWRGLGVILSGPDAWGHGAGGDESDDAFLVFFFFVWVSGIPPLLREEFRRAVNGDL